ncbi:MAG: hypothetical protein FWC33_03320 [Candidatus Bathyarchaeota archaeon]|nr:hypothetical protein [Candidatus Termiticorpusculum sp.]
MTGRLRCDSSASLVKFEVNKGFTALVCIAPKKKVNCPKVIDQYEFNQDCVFPCINPDGLPDFEVYPQ